MLKFGRHGRGGLRMRRYFFSLIVPLVLGCSGKNVVSGTDRPTPEEFRASLPGWCQKTCQRLEVCDEACDCVDDTCTCTGVDEDCALECEETLGGLAVNQHCTDVADRYKSCIDTFTCEDLASQPSCIQEEELEACEELDETTDPAPPVGATDGGSSVGTPSTGMGYAGSASGGSGPGPTAVSCGSGTGSGIGGSGAGGGPSDAQVVCEETRSNCSDGHEYGYVCVDDAMGHYWCTCFLDGDPVGAFEPAASCAMVQELNSACGWNLQD